MKKILCFILSVAMIFSCFSAGMTASALAPKDWRPEVMSEVIDPILANKNTIFGKSIDEIGYESVNHYAEIGLSLSKDSFDSFLKANADDKMLGVSYDFLYGKDNSKFLWNFLDYKLEPDLTDANISIILNGADTVANFKAWAATLGRAYTIHDIEIYAANKAGKRTTCSHKGKYDSCAEIFAGYDYDYPTKGVDKTIFDSIVESKEVIVNPFTGKEEIHYNYVYNFAKGDFGLVRANTNNQLANIIKNIWGNDNLFSTRDKANKNAVKLANFIGYLIDPMFGGIDPNKQVFTDNKRIYAELFFEKVTVLSGLDILLQDKWCKATHFDVRDIMTVLGVDTRDSVIFDAELTKGVNMGARILTDMYTEFCSDPVGYVIHILQVFCQNYEYSYKAALQALFSAKMDSMVTKSRYEKTAYPMLDSYNGFEFNTVDGFLGFIADCVYVYRVDNGGDSYANFTFAPLPVSRIAIAKDINELYVYILCYLELNRIYNGNAKFIDGFIADAVSTAEALYEAKDKETAIKDLKTVLESMFKGELTFSGEKGVCTFYLGTLTNNTIENFPDNFSSTIKRALANFIQSFLDAMDNFMNLLFGWTEGLFGGNGK